MAWIVDNGNEGYELTIGGNGKVIANKDSTGLFYYFTELKDVDIKALNTSDVTNMSHMFSGCKNLENIDLTNFDTIYDGYV